MRLRQNSQVADVYRKPAQAYKKQIEVLDGMQPGEVFVGDVGGSSALPSSVS